MTKYTVTYFPFPESDATSTMEEFGYGDTEPEQILDVINQFRRNYPLWRVKFVEKAL